MRFLLTNDDGIYARGLAALYQVLSKDAECIVVAPEVEQSAVGHAITIFRPLMVENMYYRLAGETELPTCEDEDTFACALKRGMITITPICFDLTRCDLLDGPNSRIKDHFPYI